MKQFLKIYLWQILALITGFATMFVVTPYLATEQDYFGIYTFVISLNLFLSYADFGFLNAGVKFASEAFSREDRHDELNIFGFIIFIIGVVFLIFGFVITAFYFFPHSILSGLTTDGSIALIKELFLVFIVCLPILAAHRIVQLIFNIRLQDYKYQRIYSLLNLLKIGSVFLFFLNGEYHIVGYYIFTQFLTLVTVVLGCCIAKRDYDYDFIALLKAVKFNVQVYRKTQSLAFNSLVVTVSWVVYYELDSLVIGKFVGLKEVAVFNICIAVMALARSLYAVLYNPFTAKFNHYIGKNENDQLKSTFYNVLVFGLPLSVIPTTIVIITMKSFILSWVGSQYLIAAPIAMMMFASYYFSFVSYPTGIAMVSLQKIKSLYAISVILPVVYWFGIILTFNELGLFAFGLFKFTAFFISGLFYIKYSKMFLSINWIQFIKGNVLPALVAVLGIYLISLKLNGFLPDQKGKLELIYYTIVFCLYFVIGFSIYYICCKEFRKITTIIYKQLFNHRFNG